MSNFVFGCSGWSYDDWKLHFYNGDIDSKDMLSFYSSIFKTVEINTTFYNIPRIEYVRNWVSKTPNDFIFAVKFPQSITHDKLYKDDVFKQDLTPFLDVLTALKPKLGPILIQLRPKFDKDLSKLENFFTLLPTRYKYSIEFRHKSWITDTTFQLLEKYNMAYCIVDEPYKTDERKTLIPPVLKITSDFTYIRWHGLNPKHWYDYLYSEEQLKEWKEKIQSISDSVKTVYGYFNNHPNGQAPTNCIQLLRIFGKKVRNPKSFSIVRGKVRKPTKTLDSFF
ncbi:MAG: DUF72 domain-containing protein [Candidatus Lokiarchaeota archaeon]|nr:DUF72 domain-containing protein [Candidatus Lokiarchaeota archaeon]